MTSVIVMRHMTLAVVLVLGCSTFAGDASPSADWRQAAIVEGLSSDAVDRLAHGKVLVGPRQCRQMFTPYVDAGLPPFVTSDSVLQAYHAAMEESYARVERARVRRLDAFLRTLWDGVPRAAAKFKLPAERLAEVRRRALLTVGTALRLLGGETPGIDSETAELLDEEVRRVERASERTKPAWLGPQDATFPFIDYTRFRPTSFYVGDEQLERYWRAVGWLQSIPFRPGRVDELTTALLLRDASKSCDPDADRAFQRSCEVQEFIRGLHAFVGVGDDMPVTSESGLLRAEWDASSIAEAGRTFERMGGSKRHAAGEFALRVIPPAAPADVRLLEATHVPELGRTQATCLDVAAALGSSLARQRLQSSDPKVLQEIDGFKGLAKGDDLHAAYLHCIAALAEPSEKDAPEFMRGEPWAAKSLNAILAGWAQERHSFALQIRESETLLEATELDAGFVEPCPEFFSRLADVAAIARDRLATAGAFSDEAGRAELSQMIRRYLKVVGTSKVTEVGTNALRDLPGQDRALMQGMERFAAAVAGRTLAVARESEAEAVASIRRSVEELGRLLPALESGAVLPATVADTIRASGLAAMARWNRLESVCRRLEAMAQKQLRGVAWNWSERNFLRGFGEDLAHLVGYDGDSWHGARDDVPRATAVLALRGESDAPAKHLHAAVGRPRPLYVLYPVGDHEVLCRGAVMSYYEFVRDTRLGDAEWRALIDSTDAPAPPDWFGAATTDVCPAPWTEK